MKKINITMNEFSHKLKNLKISTLGPSITIPSCVCADLNKFTTDTKHSNIMKIYEKDSVLDKLLTNGLKEKWWKPNTKINRWSYEQ